MLNNAVQEAIVDDNPPGLINLADISRAVAENRINLEVKDIMTRNFLTIDSEELIFEAIKMLGKTGRNQLVVSENDELWGMITPTDIVRALTPA